MVDSVAGYSRIAKDYDKGRPDYPPEAISFFINALELHPRQKVLDLASGTGKLTKALIGFDLCLCAVEPVEEMRSFFSERFPAVPMFEGKAESIPLPDGSMDAVLVGTAFHWFDGEKALSEIGRVLKKGGKLGLIWNIFDGKQPWVGKIRQLIEPGIDLKMCWQESFLHHPGFQVMGHHEMEYFISGKVSDVLNRIDSAKIMGTLSPKKKQELVKKALDILAADEISRQEIFGIPYRIEIDWALRRDY
jgi:SAM-dependent methyltransferase